MYRRENVLLWRNCLGKQLIVFYQMKFISTMKCSQLILLLIVSIVISCKSYEKGDLKTLRSSVFIAAENLHSPYSVGIFNDSLLIVGNYKSDFIIDIFNINDKKNVKSFKNDQKGLDLVSVTTIQTFVNNDYSFCINDILTNKLICFNKEIDDYKIKLDSSSLINLPREDYGKLLVGKNVWIGESRSSNGRLLLVDKDKQSLGFFLDYPSPDKISKYIDEKNNAKLYQPMFSLKPTMDRLAVATYGADLINVLNVKESNLEELWRRYRAYPNDIKLIKLGYDSLAVKSNRSKMYYHDITSNNHGFYLSYLGQAVSYYTKDYFSDKIYFYDWTGEKVITYNLDRKVVRIAINMDNSILYALSPDENGQLEIISFDIDHELL